MDQKKKKKSGNVSQHKPHNTYSERSHMVLLKIAKAAGVDRHVCTHAGKGEEAGALCKVDAKLGS